MSLVDAHAHVFATTDVELRVPDELAPADRAASVDDLWHSAAPTGVDSAVLVPLDADDSTAAAALAAYPGRCAGVAVAGPDDYGADAGGRLRRRRGRYPFDAVRMSWLGEPGKPLATSPTWPLLTTMAEEGLVLWSYLGPEQAAALPDLARALPDLRIVLNHLGFAPRGLTVDEHRRPHFPGALDSSTVARVLALADHPRIYLMVSGHYALSREEPPYRDLAIATRSLVNAFGPERCLWGSDFPWIVPEPGYTASLDAARQLLDGWAPAEIDLILGGTARRLFHSTLAEESI